MDKILPCVHIFTYLLFPDPWQVQSSRKDREEPLPCVCPKSHLTSGLRTIAELLNTGAVCGVPTDTVYALAASCKHPQAIEKVYRIKVGIHGSACLALGAVCEAQRGVPALRLPHDSELMSSHTRASGTIF